MDPIHINISQHKDADAILEITASHQGSSSKQLMVDQKVKKNYAKDVTSITSEEISNNSRSCIRATRASQKRRLKEIDCDVDEDYTSYDRDSSPQWNPSKNKRGSSTKNSSHSKLSLSTKKRKLVQIKSLAEVRNRFEENNRAAADSGLEDDSFDKVEPKKEKGKFSKSASCDNHAGDGVKTIKKSSVTRCEICHQRLDDPDLKLYQGHPGNAVEEFIALTDPKLCLFTGEEANVNMDDVRPTLKITHFSVYDTEGHLCPIDSGLVERDVLLYFSGYLKPVYEEDHSPQDGLPTKDIGPINEWWVSGYDGGEKVLIGFSTAFAEYYLMEPSNDYAQFMDAIKEKIYMGKLVIEFLLEEVNPSYEDLINKIQTSLPPAGMARLTEDSLLKHCQFVCDQVASLDAASQGVDDTPLIATQCIRSLVHYAGITFAKRHVMRRDEKKEFAEKQKGVIQWTIATTTPLIKNIFETYCNQQILVNHVNDSMRRKGCGICEVCQLGECGTCPPCLNILKFGGNGKSKDTCKKRKCLNLVVAEADESDAEDEDAYQQVADQTANSDLVFHRCRDTCSKKPVSWIGQPAVNDGKRTFYETANVGDMEISKGDYVSVQPADLTSPVVIGQVSSMWENLLGQKFMHVIWFCGSSETVLGETGDSHELFVVDECENLLLCNIMAKVQVKYKPRSPTWKTDGGLTVQNEIYPENSFFYSMRYTENYGRFEDVVPDPPCRNKAAEHRFCVSCERKYLSEKFETAVVDEKLDQVGPNKEIMFGVVRWRGEEYRPGTCVYLDPTTFKFNTYDLIFTAGNGKTEKIDEERFPEMYRKGGEYVKGCNDETPVPFCIGLITAVLSKSKHQIISSSDICIKVIKFYRPENTIGITTQYHQLDLNLLYASDEEQTINFQDVMGKCTIVYRENIMGDISTWSEAGPHRFYFVEAYDKSNKQSCEPINLVKQLGDVGKGGGKVKGKSKGNEKRLGAEPPQQYPALSRPLRCLDVFAGCGGLSEGLHQAGIAETLWAIEKDEPAATAFKLNNPAATVFTDDCNALLQLILNGETKTDKGQKLPLKGEVEMLVGGPPCQGFSGMNRFHSRQYSLFKNSLIVSYLSYCDFYRPRFFILENVRNFVSFKRCMVLKLTLHALVRMGYQVTFGVLQAGNYGVPQTRSRTIIMAAAPGETLPNYPEPSHVFNLRASQLSVMVDNKKFMSNCQWIYSAPYRTITVRDSMSDLPQVYNGANIEEMPYNGQPLSHFQRMMRAGQEGAMLRDHICKEMAPIVEARMAHIPKSCGSDWRDLPNISVKLSDGNITKKLQYSHHDKKNGKSSAGGLRGVCACASGKACDPMDRQFNTLIPWCLPHTGNRHNHWAGLYGRLEWEGFFSTTITNPEPMGKQGRVLHPEQTRVVSVRECARSQGFPDKYRFYGTILHKHRQIGNAVPPPLGAAIGREIGRSVSIFENKQLEETTNKHEELNKEIKKN